MEKQIHKLNTPGGVTLTLTLSVKPFHYSCEWSEMPKNKKRRERVIRQYVDWRDRIFEQAAQDNQVCIMSVTPGFTHMGIPAVAVYGNEYSECHGGAVNTPGE